METRPRVLVIDDEPFIRTSLRVILNQEGFDVLVAEGGKDGLAKAIEWRPDIVLSDVIMPDLDGITASMRIADALPDCKFVLLSGHAVVYNLIQPARERGYPFELLLKPIHPAELIQHLRMMLERRQ